MSLLRSFAATHREAQLHQLRDKSAQVLQWSGSESHGCCEHGLALAPRRPGHVKVAHLLTTITQGCSTQEVTREPPVLEHCTRHSDQLFGRRHHQRDIVSGGGGIGGKESELGRVVRVVPWFRSLHVRRTR